MNYDPTISWEDDASDEDYAVAAPADAPEEALPTFDVVGGTEVEAVVHDGDKMTVIQLDADGNEVSSVVDLSATVLNQDEAREITDRIRSTTNILYVLIKRAHAGKAWEALGYTSFGDYVKQEFNYSRSYAYKLLNQANVIEAIEQAAPEGTEVHVGELTARGLKKSLPELVEVIEERTADATPEEATSIIESAIAEMKGQKDEEDSFFDTDEDFDSTYNPGEYTGNGAEFEMVDDDEDVDPLGDLIGGNNDPSAVIRRLENLHGLLTSLLFIEDLKKQDMLTELLPLIPTDREAEFTRLINTNADWSGVIKDEWDAYLGENSQGGNSDGDDFGDEVVDDDDEGKW